MRNVRVTVSQPGLPPPFGAPRVTSFATQSELARVTSALNRHHIAKLQASSSGGGCAGGFQIGISVTRSGSAPAGLSAYRCGGRTSGDIGGDLVGFLSDVGISL